ncbi:MAG: phosphatidate cytidylyltransferase [Flavipsychrobacter sp.]|nr:phosphatidate cytidylyltransferase [Flavipsychrobacter sp.]
MALNVPVFFTRLGSSVVFVAIMLTGLLWNEWAFLGLILIINILCLRDYFRLMRKIDKEHYWPMWLPVVIHVIAVLGLLIFSGFRLPNDELIDDRYIKPHVRDIFVKSTFIFIVWPVLFSGLMLISMLSKKVSFSAMLQSVGGLFYITLPIMLLCGMRVQYSLLPLVLILMIWSNDTMAYLVGSFFGKHPFSSISPKKTWEGTIGGAIITIVAAGLVGYFTHTYRIIDWIMLALCATVAGTLGDLLESKLKRLADVKDSGTLMPGHGGALDRFDSLLVATPFAFVYVLLFMH